MDSPRRIDGACFMFAPAARCALLPLLGLVLLLPAIGCGGSDSPPSDEPEGRATSPVASDPYVVLKPPPVPIALEPTLPKERLAAPRKPPGRRPRPAIRLEITTSSWRDKVKFNVESEIRAMLNKVGVVVADGKSESVDGALFVEYHETEGGEYRRWLSEGEETIGTGTDIDLTVVCEGAGLIEGVKPLSISAGTGEYAQVSFGNPGTDGLYQAALKNLGTKSEFPYLGEYVAVAFGVRPAIRRVVRDLALVDDKFNVSALLKALNFQPRNDEEAAYVKVAKRDYAGCEKLGRASVPALTRLMNESAKAAEEGDSEMEWSTVGEAAASLGRIGGPEAEDALRERLRTFSLMGPNWERESEDSGQEDPGASAYLRTIQEYQGEAIAGLLKGSEACKSPFLLAETFRFQSDGRKLVREAADRARAKFWEQFNFQAAAPKPEAPPTITLQLQIQSWRGKRFAIEESVRKGLAERKILVVDSGAAAADALCLARYRERPGSPIDSRGGYGTVVHFEVLLLDPRGKEIVAWWGLSGYSRDKAADGKTSHASAVRDLIQSPGYASLWSEMAEKLHR